MNRYDPMDDQRHEDERVVFEALLDETDLSNEAKVRWVLRMQEAESAKRRLRAYSEEWDRSLLGVTRFGQ
jgi:hypothetical protein